VCIARAPKPALEFCALLDRLWGKVVPKIVAVRCVSFKKPAKELERTRDAQLFKLTLPDRLRTRSSFADAVDSSLVGSISSTGKEVYALKVAFSAFEISFLT
jgi:hypothetical protein